MASSGNSIEPPSVTSTIPGANRAAASSPSSVAGSYATTNGGASNGNYASPLPAGHQQDLNYLYEQIQELSKVLQANRVRTAELTKIAESVERNHTTNNTNTTNGNHIDEEHDAEGSVQSDKARIRQLERQLTQQTTLLTAYAHEQKENTALIAMYEDTLGTTTESIRNYASSVESRFLEQRRVYNNLLQQEKDEHLSSRLEKDHWFAKYMEVREMVRTAGRLRGEEFGEEYAVVAGLQGQVRCLRRVLGWEKERVEEELGWGVLREGGVGAGGGVEE